MWQGALKKAELKTDQFSQFFPFIAMSAGNRPGSVYSNTISIRS